MSSISGRSYDMIRSHQSPATISRSYSGVFQSGGFDFNMNPSNPMSPPANFFVSGNNLRFKLPPPNYLQNYPPPPISPQANYLNHNLIPTAAPNSPATPTTPRTFNYPFPLYSFFPNKGVVGSPMSSSTSAPTFQQHMMQHSPSPLITPTKSPFIVQPISRGDPEFAGLENQDKQMETELSHNLRNGLVFSGQSAIGDN